MAHFPSTGSSYSMDSLFWGLLKKLIGLSVWLYIDDFAFKGKITSLEKHYLVMATSKLGKSGTVTTLTSPVITYVPLHSIQAVSRK